METYISVLQLLEKSSTTRTKVRTAKWLETVGMLTYKDEHEDIVWSMGKLIAARKGAGSA